jgi:hypothetical protein
MSDVYTTMVNQVNSLTNLLIGNVSPLNVPSISGDQNDFNPASLSTSTQLNLTSSLAVAITGLTAQSDGKSYVVKNVGNYGITFTDSSTSSLAANRFNFGADFILAPGKVFYITYDAATSKWLPATGIPGVIADGGTVLNIQNQLIATNTAISTLTTSKVNVSDKANNTVAVAGTDDTKWLTPLKTKAMIQSLSPPQTFTSIVTALGYTPANKAGGLITGNTSFTGGKISIYGFGGDATKARIMLTSDNTKYIGSNSTTLYVTGLNGGGTLYTSGNLTGTVLNSIRGYTPANKAGESFTLSVSANNFTTRSNYIYFGDTSHYMVNNAGTLQLTGMNGNGTIYTTGNLNSAAIASILGYTPMNPASAPTFAADISSTTGQLWLYGQNGTAGSSTGAIFFDNHLGTHYLSFDGSNFNFVGGTIVQNGTILATGDVIAYYSDQRLKDVTSHVNGSLDIISNLDVIRFKPNDLALSIEGAVPSDKIGVEDISLLAQQVQASIPEAVTIAPFDRDKDGSSKSGEDYLTIKWEKIVVHLVQSVKELKEQNDILKAEIELLKKS